MRKSIGSSKNIFESIRHIDEEGKEYWSARELQKILEYTQWRRFESTIGRAMDSCRNCDINIQYHFATVGKTINMPKGAQKIINDYHLSRYACYLIAQNGDSRKKTIALAQTYFAIQTRRQELLDEFESLPENEKRKRKRNEIRHGNYDLNRTAVKVGVKNLDKFHNAGYRGLYNGETADDIAKRKGLRYREDILDNMGSSELIANQFRIDQTNQKLKREAIYGEKEACDVHYIVGKKVRQTISELGGTMPEDLPLPDKSLKELKREQLKKISGGSLIYGW